MADTTPPSLANSFYRGLGTGYTATGDIAIIFNEPVQLGTGTIVLKDSNGSILDTFDAATSPALSIYSYNSSAVRINPTADLVYGKDYVVQFSAGSVKDVAGNAIAAPVSFSFTYVDDTVDSATGPVPPFPNPPGGQFYQYSSAVDYPGDVDWHAINLVAGHTYTFRLTANTGNNVDPALSLYDPASALIASDDNSGGNGAALLTYTPTTTGKYFIETKASPATATVGGVLLSIDDPAPPVLLNGPPNGSSPSSTLLQVNFSEVINRGSGTISLKDAGGNVIESFDVGTSTRVATSGATLTITPSAALAYGSTYHVVIPAGGVVDNSATPFAGADYAFTTDDYANFGAGIGAATVGGTLTGTIEQTYDSDGFSIPLTAGHTYTFRVDPGAGSSLDPYVGLMTAQGKSVSSTPTDDNSGGGTSALYTFAPFTSGNYLINIANGGNHSTTGTYQLAVNEIVAPAITSFAPHTGAAPDANFTVNFTDPIQRGTGTITLKKGTNVVETFDAATSNRISISGSTLTIDPTADLTYGGYYSVVLNPGIVKDLAGHDFAAGLTLQFSTDDHSAAPVGSGTLHVELAIGGSIETSTDKDWFAVSLPAGRKITFQLDAATGSTLDPFLTLYAPDGTRIASDDNGAGGTSSLINFAVTTAGTYYVEAASSNGASSGSYSLHASDAGSVDVIPPYVSFVIPTPDSPTSSLDTNLLVRFSESVVRGTGTITLRTASGAVVETFDAATSTRVTISGSLLTIDPTANLDYGTNYQIYLAPGTIKDLAGNGYQDTATYDFSTVAAPSPAPSSSPAPAPAPATSGTTTTVTTASAPAVPLTQVTSSLSTSLSTATSDQVLNLFSTSGAVQASVITSNGTTTLAGTGSDGRDLVAVVPSTSATTTDLVDGSLRLHTELPAGEGTLLSGRDQVTPDVANAFLQSVVSATYPRPAAGSVDEGLRNSLQSAIASQQSALSSGGSTSTTVRYVDFVATGSPSGSLVLDTTAAGQNELLMVNLGHAAGTVTVRGVENLVLAGAGTTRLEGSTAARVTNDSSAQTIIGGAGNETIISSGGDDTFTGGGGSNTFAFAGIGHYTITDFNVATDHLAFNFGGINRIADIVPFITSVDQTASGITFHFGAAASITLVGVQASQLTGDLVTFHV